MPTNNEPNRLIIEKSPYLLQHAHNPVHWYPWGDEAFEKAKQVNKPIFLSIGYSTCHWCHVMAHESFEDAEVAALLNEKYISIKVDREERPDIDSVYMKVCQMMNGHGGWPLSVFMTPDKVPFYTGTYFPKTSKYGRPGFMEVLTQLHKKFMEDPEHISDVTKTVTNALNKSTRAKSKKRLSKDTIKDAYQQLARSFDFTYGGFGEAPKFPMPQNLMFLLRHHYFTGNAAPLKIVEQTLQDMAAGGIWDHVGYGFARYSTDDEWLVPHFEKMLYDNALLLMVYTECYQITKKPFYKQIAENIITFIKREMMGTDGAFFSAIDADSEGVEGKYYVWAPEEIMNVLGSELGKLYCQVYDITEEGNFEGKSIPNLIDRSLEDFAEENKISLKELLSKMEKARLKLLEAREKRVYPHVDDKTLTAWKGMMIAALAKAGRVFSTDGYTEMAIKAMNFIEEKLHVENRLMARFRDGETKYKGYIDDHAFLLWGYIELYQSTFSIDYLARARQLADQLISLFWDNENGGFFFTGKDSEELIAKDKEIYDGAIPSGNSVAAVMLTRLGNLTGEMTYLEKVEEMFYTFFEDVNRQASASPFFLISLMLMENQTKEVVLLGKQDNQTFTEFLANLQHSFLPNVSVLVGELPEHFKKVSPFAAEYKPLEDSPTVYICENFACRQPTNNLQEAWTTIQEIGT